MPNFSFPHTFHDGVNETASGSQVSEDFQLLKEKIEALEDRGSKSVATVHRKAAQSCASGVVTKVELDTVDHDPGAHFDATKHAYVAPAEGYYQVSAQIDFGEYIGGVGISVYVNGAFRHEGAQAGSTAGATLSAVVFLKAGDELDLRMVQESGAPRSLVTSEGFYNYLHVVRVA